MVESAYVDYETVGVIHGTATKTKQVMTANVSLVEISSINIKMKKHGVGSRVYWVGLRCGSDGGVLA